MNIQFNWKQPGNRKSMAREIVAAYKLRIRLQDDGGLMSTPEALVAEEKADQMAAEFLRTFGETYHRHS